MTRLEMLKWMWKNCYDNTSAHYYVDVRNYIGNDYYYELKDMGFIIGFHKESYSYVHLSPLGRAYCDEIFRQMAFYENYCKKKTMEE